MLAKKSLSQSLVKKLNPEVVEVIPLTTKAIGIKAAKETTMKVNATKQKPEKDSGSLVLVNGVAETPKQKPSKTSAPKKPAEPTKRKNLTNSEKKIASDFTQGQRVNKAMETIGSITANAVADLTEKEEAEAEVAPKQASFVKPTVKTAAKPMVQGGKLSFQAYLDEKNKPAEAKPVSPFKFR